MTATMSVRTNQHYDLEPGIFESFLGETMKYSCARFDDADASLDDAQRCKMDWVASELRLEAGDRVLDVGCGWGSLSLHLAALHGCSVVGVTPSNRQSAYVRRQAVAQHLADRVEVVTAEIGAVQLAPRSFRAVTLLGSIVHIPEHDAVLAQAYRATAHGGRLYLSESCYRNEAISKRFVDSAGSRYVIDEIFGAADVVPVSKLISAVENAGYALKAVHDLTEHYRATIERWRSNLQRLSPSERVDGDMIDRLLRYLEIANASWGFTSKHYAIVAERSR